MGRGPAITMQDVGNVLAAKLIDPLMPDTRIALAVGRSDTTVGRIAERFAGVLEEYRGLNRRQIVDDLDAVRRGYLARLAEPEVIEACSGPQAGVVFGILTDKLLLESGRPTSITLNANADVSLPDVLGRLQRAIQGRAGQAGQGSTRQDKADA